MLHWTIALGFTKFLVNGRKMHYVKWLLLWDAGQTKLDSVSWKLVCSQCGQNHC